MKSSQLEQLRAFAIEKKRTLDDAIEYWNERAAICQYDGGLTRDQAELNAMEQVKSW